MNAFLKRLASRWAWLLAAGALAVLLSGGCAPAVNGRMITFSGYTWNVKNSDKPVGPGPNLFSDSPENVWVDKFGALHLKITRRGGKWYSSEVTANLPLKYGAYTWVVTSPLNTFDRSVVLGFFTWDNNAPDLVYREMDIEIARWKVPDGPNVQYVVQPYTARGNRVQFTMPLSHISMHRFDWNASRVQFDSWEGVLHETWTFSKPADIPPEGTGSPRINLWLFEGTPPADGKDVEVVIQSFLFQGAASPSSAVGSGSH